MKLTGREKRRAWITAVAVSLIVALLALAHTTWAQEVGNPDYCSWIKQARVNGGGLTLITEVTPAHFGVVVSDTVHIYDTLVCDINYAWFLQESWDPDLLSLAGEPGWTVDVGEVDEYPPGFLSWWGEQPAGQWAHLNKYLHVDQVGWSNTEIAENIEFNQTDGEFSEYRELYVYLHELVEGGDAPSSYNHTASPMQTHITGTVASFPVVWDWDGTMDPAPPSYGFCHYSSLAPSFLGTAPSYELDADLTPDDDGSTNIDPPNDTPDQDGSDDGVDFPTALPNCGTATVNVVGENNLGSDLYLNAWADWNRDGDWDDTSVCSCEISEWIIQGYVVPPGPFDLDIEFNSCHAVPDPTELLWVRFTLSEMNPLTEEPWIYGGQPYPASTGCFWEGETEDFYVVPELNPHCEWDKQVYINDELAGEWDEGPFPVVVDDIVSIHDTLTCDFEYSWYLLEEWDTTYLELLNTESLECWPWPPPPPPPGEFEWSGGPVPPGTPVTLTKTLRVKKPGFALTEIAESVAYEPAFVEGEERQVNLIELLEGGDAPSSHNHGEAVPPMETYPGSGVTARYPVVWDWNGELGPGPETEYYGFCHYSGNGTYLGSPPSFEVDADLLFDQDLLTNIDPATNTPDRDLSDDGVDIPGGLPECAQDLTMHFTGHNGVGSYLYLNVWADWNRDGDWEDGSQCGCGDHEWAIRDHLIKPCPIDEEVKIIPCHPGDPGEPLWIRVTLTNKRLGYRGEPWIYGGQPYPATDGCFQVGETQDYLFQQQMIYSPIVISGN